MNIWYLQLPSCPSAASVSYLFVSGPTKGLMSSWMRALEANSKPTRTFSCSRNRLSWRQEEFCRRGQGGGGDRQQEVLVQGPVSVKVFTYRCVNRLVGLQASELDICTSCGLDLLHAEGGVVKQGQQRGEGGGGVGGGDRRWRATLRWHSVQDQRTGARVWEQRRSQGLGLWTGMIDGIEERWYDGHWGRRKMKEWADW